MTKDKELDLQVGHIRDVTPEEIARYTAEAHRLRAQMMAGFFANIGRQLFGKRTSRAPAGTVGKQLGGKIHAS